VKQGWKPRVFETGCVYRTVLNAYSTTDSRECIYLVLGADERDANWWEGYAVNFTYLDLLTGHVDEFHRDSYFACSAEPLW